MDCFGLVPLAKTYWMAYALLCRQHVFASQRRSNPESITLRYCVCEVNKWIASGLHPRKDVLDGLRLAVTAARLCEPRAW